MLDAKGFEKAIKNSEFVLFKIAEAKTGDNIIVIGDSDSYQNDLLFCHCAKKHGINAMRIDLDIYGGEEGYDNLPIMEPLRQAIFAADISFMTTPQVKTSFSHFLGSQSSGDTALTGAGKRYIFEIDGLDKWDLNEEEVMLNRKRALALYSWLKKANEVHVTSAKGTDFKVKVGNEPDGMYPVMGIIPFYSEVAIVPKIGTANGTVVADGASERTYNQRCFPIRPNVPGFRELNREPMKMVYENSVLTEYSGDPIQVERFDTLMEKVNPKPNLCDELGLVTTTSAENNIYGWKVDESHQRHCVHVAIGNNSNRKEIIHSTEHVDFDVHNPIVMVDGKVIYDGEKFNDELIFSMAD